MIWRSIEWEGRAALEDQGLGGSFGVRSGAIWGRYGAGIPSMGLHCGSQHPAMGLGADRGRPHTSLWVLGALLGLPKITLWGWAPGFIYLKIIYSQE